MRAGTDTSLLAPKIAYRRADPWLRLIWLWHVAGRHDDGPVPVASTRSRSTS